MRLPVLMTVVLAFVFAPSRAHATFDPRVVHGFSHTHLSGAGVSDYGDILLFPALGTPKWRNARGRPAGDGYGSPFRKVTEQASPGYYAVTL